MGVFKAKIVLDKGKQERKAIAIVERGKNSV